MACGEHQTEQVVTDLVVQRRLGIRHGTRISGLQVPADLLNLAFEPLLPANEVDGPVFRRRHQPRARIVRHA
jgi:hypothetical protein